MPLISTKFPMMLRTKSSAFGLLCFVAMAFPSAQALAQNNGAEKAKASLPAKPLNPPLPTTELLIGKHKVLAELATTPKEREIGLMNRPKLRDDQGMLFVFQKSQAYCFWMKNTPIDLDIAFINSQFEIVNTAHMKAQSLTPHCASSPVSYALEMRAGWFNQYQVLPGQVVIMKKPH